MPGFGVRVKSVGKGGAKSFIADYVSPVDTRKRRTTLGRAEKMSLEQARRHTRKLFGQVADGREPAGREAPEA